MQKGEKQKTLEEANKWENANRPRKAEEEEPSRVGDRPFARGRAYVADRFGPNAPAETAAPAPEEQPEAPAQAEQPETPAVPEEIPYGENSITEGEIKDTSKDNGE